MAAAVGRRISSGSHVEYVSNNSEIPQDIISNASTRGSTRSTTFFANPEAAFMMPRLGEITVNLYEPMTSDGNTSVSSNGRTPETNGYSRTDVARVERSINVMGVDQHADDFDKNPNFVSELYIEKLKTAQLYGSNGELHEKEAESKTDVDNNQSLSRSVSNTSTGNQDARYFNSVDRWQIYKEPVIVAGKALIGQEKTEDEVRKISTNDALINQTFEVNHVRSDKLKMLENESSLNAEESMRSDLKRDSSRRSSSIISEPSAGDVEHRSDYLHRFNSVNENEMIIEERILPNTNSQLLNAEKQDFSLSEQIAEKPSIRGKKIQLNRVNSPENGHFSRNESLPDLNNNVKNAYTEYTYQSPGKIGNIGAVPLENVSPRPKGQIKPRQPREKQHSLDMDDFSPSKLSTLADNTYSRSLSYNDSQSNTAISERKPGVHIQRTPRPSASEDIAAETLTKANELKRASMSYKPVSYSEPQTNTFDPPVSPRKPGVHIQRTSRSSTLDDIATEPLMKIDEIKRASANYTPLPYNESQTHAIDTPVGSRKPGVHIQRTARSSTLDDITTEPLTKIDEFKRASMSYAPLPYNDSNSHTAVSTRKPGIHIQRTGRPSASEDITEEHLTKTDVLKRSSMNYAPLPSVRSELLCDRDEPRISNNREKYERLSNNGEKYERLSNNGDKYERLSNNNSRGPETSQRMSKSAYENKMPDERRDPQWNDLRITKELHPHSPGRAQPRMVEEIRTNRDKRRRINRSPSPVGKYYETLTNVKHGPSWEDILPKEATSTMRIREEDRHFPSFQNYNNNFERSPDSSLSKVAQARGQKDINPKMSTDRSPYSDTNHRQFNNSTSPSKKPSSSPHLKRTESDLSQEQPRKIKKNQSYKSRSPSPAEAINYEDIDYIPARDNALSESALSSSLSSVRLKKHKDQERPREKLHHRNQKSKLLRKDISPKRASLSAARIIKKNGHESPIDNIRNTNSEQFSMSISKSFPNDEPQTRRVKKTKMERVSDTTHLEANVANPSRTIVVVSPMGAKITNAKITQCPAELEDPLTGIISGIKRSVSVTEYNPSRLSNYPDYETGRISSSNSRGGVITGVINNAQISTSEYAMTPRGQTPVAHPLNVSRVQSTVPSPDYNTRYENSLKAINMSPNNSISLDFTLKESSFCSDSEDEFLSQTGVNSLPQSHHRFNSSFATQTPSQNDVAFQLDLINLPIVNEKKYTTVKSQSIERYTPLHVSNFTPQPTTPEPRYILHAVSDSPPKKSKRKKSIRKISDSVDEDTIISRRNPLESPKRKMKRSEWSAKSDYPAQHENGRNQQRLKAEERRESSSFNGMEPRLSNARRNQHELSAERQDPSKSSGKKHISDIKNRHEPTTSHARELSPSRSSSPIVVQQENYKKERQLLRSDRDERDKYYRESSENASNFSALASDNSTVIQKLNMSKPLKSFDKQRKSTPSSSTNEIHPSEREKSIKHVLRTSQEVSAIPRTITTPLPADNTDCEHDDSMNSELLKLSKLLKASPLTCMREKGNNMFEDNDVNSTSSRSINNNDKKTVQRRNQAGNESQTSDTDESRSHQKPSGVAMIRDGDTRTSDKRKPSSSGSGPREKSSTSAFGKRIDNEQNQYKPTGITNSANAPHDARDDGHRSRSIQRHSNLLPDHISRLSGSSNIQANAHEDVFNGNENDDIYDEIDMGYSLRSNGSIPQMDERSDLMTDLSHIKRDSRRTRLSTNDSFSSDIPSSYRGNHLDNVDIESGTNDMFINEQHPSVNDDFGMLRSSRPVTEDVPMFSPEVYGERLDQKMNEHLNTRIQEIMDKAASRRGVRSLSTNAEIPQVVPPPTQRTHSLPYDDDEFDTVIDVNRDFSVFQHKREQANNGDAREYSEENNKTTSTNSTETLDQFDIKSLYEEASASSFKQKISVQRIEDEILNSLPTPTQPTNVTLQEDTGVQFPQGVQSPLDYTMIEEQIDLSVIEDGRAVLTARVRSEKISPILGAVEMYKKSAVIITKVLEVDLSVTPRRKRLHELLMRRLRVESGGGLPLGGALEARQTESSPDLTPDEKKQVYRVFLGLAELYKAV